MGSIGNIDDILSSGKNQPYSASARVNDDGIDLASTTTTGTLNAREVNNELGKDDFLLLLVTQLKYQDPLKPMENTEFIAQMAQFSALEGTKNIEKAIGTLNDAMQGSVLAQQRSSNAMASTAAVSLIGKSVRMQVTDLKWTNAPGEKIDIPIYMGGNSEATVEIKDSKGTVVKTLTATGKDSQNTVHVIWDGTSEKGESLAAGMYSVHIVGQERDSSLYAFVEDVVTGVRFTDDNAMLKIHGMELPLGAILDVASGTQGQNQNLSQSSAVALIGKNVRVRQSEVAYSGAQNEQVGIKVNATPGTMVEVKICNADGKTIQTITGRANDKGVAFLTWDGLKSDGTRASAGEYEVRITGAANNPSLYAFVDGKVEGVSNLANGTYVRIAGVTFNVSDIVDISESQGTASV